MAFLELQGVSKNFGERSVLRNVDLAVEEGEFVSIIGMSGAGKTTLLKIASGLMPASEGAAILDGRAVTGFPAGASIVFQNYSLLPWFSAFENVRLAVESAFPGWPRPRQAEQSKRYLEMAGLGAAMEKRPSQLSGGMRQRVAIARAFAVEPRILFLDEPFGALDALTRATLQQELARMCQESARSVTALLITNSIDEAILLSDRVVAMEKSAVATLKPSVAIPLPKPRKAAVLQSEEAFRLRAQISGFLRPEVRDGKTRAEVGLVLV